MLIKMRLVALIFFLFVGFSDAGISSKIGINYGQLGNNLPSPYQSIELMKSLKVGSVKLYDANPEILKLLSDSKIRVSIMVQNHEIIDISINQTLADQWIRDNVLPFLEDTLIRVILVGNEVLSYFSDNDLKIWHHLVPAMRRIKNSLKAQNIRNIKVGTPLAMDVMQTTFPPSSGTFRCGIVSKILTPLLRFLNQTNSFFFIDVYPYFPWSRNPTNISLDYALLQGDVSYTDPNSGLTYTNLLDQMLDSIFFAMAKLGFPNIRLSIAETGWPNAGDIDQVGANIFNAAVYNRNLVRKMTAKPPLGTPARLGQIIPTFIFSLYNENLKTGPGTERHWGLVDPNGRPIYEVDLTGKRPVTEYRPLPAPHNNRPYKGKVWCVVARGTNATQLSAALTYTCAQGNGTCDALMPGKACYEPVSVVWHASYAFSSYWAKFRSQGATCYFDGQAEQTTTNPSRGSCKFPSVTL